LRTFAHLFQGKLRHIASTVARRITFRAELLLNDALEFLLKGFAIYLGTGAAYKSRQQPLCIR
jgi:hypothetical protein